MSEHDDELAGLLKPLPEPPPKSRQQDPGRGEPALDDQAALRRRILRRRHLRYRRHPRRTPLVRHPLHPLEITSMAVRTARLEPARVLVPALVIFGLDAFQSTWFTEISTDHLGLESATTAVIFGASTLGLTFYSGMLERLVGAVERNQTPQPVGQVLATLPWLRLLIAEAILFVVTALTALFLIIPALVAGTLCALVGPLINLLDCSVPEAFRRSIRVVWPHFWLVLVMITIPLAVEHEVVILIKDLVPHEQALLVFVTNFVMGLGFGVALGLVEVSLAERLVTGAHGPGHDLRSEDADLAGGAAAM